MTRPMWVKHSSAAIAALAFVWRPRPAALNSHPPRSPTLPDRPQVFRTAAGTIRVTAIKGSSIRGRSRFCPTATCW